MRSQDVRLCKFSEWYKFSNPKLSFTLAVPKLHSLCSGRVVSVFPAWTTSALLANFSLSFFSLSLFLPLSLCFLPFVSWSYYDFTMVTESEIDLENESESEPVTEWMTMTGTPHSADIKEWIIYQDPPQIPALPHPASPTNTPLPTSVWIRRDAEHGSCVSAKESTPAWEQILSWWFPHPSDELQKAMKRLCFNL